MRPATRCAAGVRRRGHGDPGPTLTDVTDERDRCIAWWSLVAASAASRLPSRCAIDSTADDEVVLVERRPTFVMGLRKNWALVGASTIAEGERSLSPARGARHPGPRPGRSPPSTRRRARPTSTASDPGGRCARRRARCAAAIRMRSPGSASTPSTSTTCPPARPARRRSMRSPADAWSSGSSGRRIRARPGPYEVALLLMERFEARGVPGGMLVFTPQPGSLPILGTDGCAAFDGRLAGGGSRSAPRPSRRAVEAGCGRDPGRRAPPLRPAPRRAAASRPAGRRAAGLTGADGGSASIARPSQTRFEGVYAIGDVTVIPIADGNGPAQGRRLRARRG